LAVLRPSCGWPYQEAHPTCPAWEVPRRPSPGLVISNTLAQPKIASAVLNVSMACPPGGTGGIRRRHEGTTGGTEPRGLLWGMYAKRAPQPRLSSSLAGTRLRPVVWVMCRGKQATRRRHHQGASGRGPSVGGVVGPLRGSRTER